MNGRRVVVTGLGLVTSVGHDVASSWSAIKAGRSGAATITAFDVEAYS
ncbi:MAG: beta-ketoacyl synthase N-terminal-like domain-containing protein, partial [Pseudomonadota bacterium]